MMNLQQGPYNNPANEIRELTTVTYWDEVALGVSTTLTSALLFQNSGKTQELQNLQLPSQLDRSIMVTHISCIHNFQFTVTNAAHAVTEQQRFENDSVLVYTLQDKNYPGIPLSFMNAYQTTPAGTGMGSTPYYGRFFPLKDPI